MKEDVIDEFERFMANWDKSFEGHIPAWKKARKEIEDKTLPKVPPDGPPQNKTYHNVWELFEDHGIKRSEVESMNIIGYSAVTGNVKSIEIGLFNGDAMTFKDVQLEEKLETATIKPTKHSFDDIKF